MMGKGEEGKRLKGEKAKRVRVKEGEGDLANTLALPIQRVVTFSTFSPLNLFTFSPFLLFPLSPLPTGWRLLLPGGCH
jgi:hypothetical protein